MTAALFWLCLGQGAQSEITTSGGGGVCGYIPYGSSQPPTGYGAGMSFYSAIWPLSDEALAFQIGLAGSWMHLNNEDNLTVPLAPAGTVARLQLQSFGPTYKDVFQTLEGGLVDWLGNQFSHGQPKFAMNSTPQCYDYEIATPGFSFFQGRSAPPPCLGSPTASTSR